MYDAANIIFSLDDSEKWGAVAASDKSYDGLFFYGVKTTGIFCRPSCASKTPLRRNVIFFDELDHAINSGFRPCKKCRPDLHGYDPNHECVEKVKEVYAQSFADPHRLSNLAGQLGISANHLMRLFKHYEGCTQGQHLAKLRIKKAKHFLNKTDMNIIQIALSCGFESLSNFYKRFHDLTGVTPAQYRRNGGEK